MSNCQTFLEFWFGEAMAWEKNKFCPRLLCAMVKIALLPEVGMVMDMEFRQ